MRRLFFAALCMALLPSLTIAQIVPDAAGSFDFVDDFLSPSSGPTVSVPGTYDIFGFTGTGTASTGPDGRADFSIKTTTFGLGADGNNVTWDANVDVNGTGLRSTIDPTFLPGGGYCQQWRASGWAKY